MNICVVTLVLLLACGAAASPVALSRTDALSFIHASKSWDTAKLAQYPVLASLINKSDRELTSKRISLAFVSATQQQLDLWSRDEESRAPGHHYRVFEPPRLGLHAPRRSEPHPPGPQANDNANANANSTALLETDVGVLNELYSTRGRMALVSDEEPLPTTFDPRNASNVHGVHCAPAEIGRQWCGDCSVWSTTTSYEWRYCMDARKWELEFDYPGGEIKTELPALSNQYGVDCIIGNCSAGSWADRNFKHFKKHGWPSESCRPYKAPDVMTPCNEDKLQCTAKGANVDPVDYEITGFHLGISNKGKGGHVSTAKRILVEEGPFYVSVRLPRPSIFLYGGSDDKDQSKINIFSTPPDANDDVNTKHAVTLIGWGSQDGVEYWIIQNSWGTSWGDRGWGYLKIENDYIKWPHSGRLNPQLRFSPPKQAHLDKVLAQREKDRQTASYRVLALDSQHVADTIGRLSTMLSRYNLVEKWRLGNVGRIDSTLQTLRRAWRDVVAVAVQDPTSHKKRCEAFYGFLVTNADMPKWFSDAELAHFRKARDTASLCETSVAKDANVLVDKARSAVEALLWLVTDEQGSILFAKWSKAFGAYCTRYRKKHPDLCTRSAYFTADKWKPDSGKIKRLGKKVVKFAERAKELLSVVTNERVLSGAAWWQAQRAADNAERTCHWLAEACCGRHSGGTGTGFGVDFCPVTFN